jgi:hypothetical protein
VKETADPSVIYEDGNMNDIIPAAAESIRRAGEFDFTKPVCIRNDAGLKQEAGYLKVELEALGVVVADAATSSINLALEDGEPERYSLVIEPGSIRIQGGSRAGIFLGIQTLRQMLPLFPGEARSRVIPCGVIKDAPRFSWRGYMLDESRHFFGKAYVKKILDWMALLKLNRFHWHLTDEPAWRIEIKKYPRLTGVGGCGSWSDPDAPREFYTQDDIREIVDYARDRHIVVVPEIDMPGHATAANRAYPEFSGGGSERCPEFTFNPGREETYAYLEGILREVAGLFPGQWIHFGGDEVHFGNEQWNHDPHVQAMMQREGLTTLKQVEFYFIERMAAFIKSLGKTAIGWDEIVGSNIPPGDAAVMWWRNDRPKDRDEAVKKGYQTILCPRIPCYFDFIQDPAHKWGRRTQGNFGTVDQLYMYPDAGDVPVHGADRIIGVQGNLWTEYVKGAARADFMSFPRMFALAEAGWTPQEAKDPASFHRRLKRFFPVMENRGTTYFNPFDPQATPEVPGVDKKQGPARLEEEIQAVVNGLPPVAFTTCCAQTLENDLLKVEVKGQDISISSKVSAKVSVPRLNVAKKIESVKTGPNEMVLSLEDGWGTTLSLEQGSPFLHIFTGIANNTAEATTYSQVNLLTLVADCGTTLEKARALGTGGLTPVGEAEGSFAFSVIADPDSRHSVVCGYLTHERGIGILFPKAVDGKPTINAKIDFGSLRVEPGKTRGTETLLIGLFEDGRLGLEAYAGAVARKYTIKLRPRPNAYCTWYHAWSSNEKALAENTAFAEKHLKPFGLNVMQIDDKWQTPVPEGFKYEGTISQTGPWKCFTDANQNYPGGMAHTATNIASHGMIPGIWFMPWAGNKSNPYFDQEIYARNPDGTPFHDAKWSGTCIDSTSPKGEAFIRERIKRIYDWGYRYFKIDGMHTGMATKNVYIQTAYNNPNDGFGEVVLHAPDMTQVQAYRKCLMLCREEAPDALVLGCNVSQNMRSMGPAFGLIDAMRIGPDNNRARSGEWATLLRGPWHGSNLYFLNGRVWFNDPDPVYVRETNPLEKARWMCSWLAVSGAMHTSSENYGTLPPERLDLLKRCLPGHDCTARPVDYLETDKPQIWLAGNDRMHVIGLFNWNETDAATIEYDMGKLGLDKAKAYAGFDFWANTFVSPFSGTLKQTLPGGTCRVIAVKPIADRPVLLSTSRHITQGLIDVLEEKWDAGSKTLCGKSLVVAGDPYELRIALPAEGNFKPASARLGNKDVPIGDIDGNGVRISFTPESSGTVEWSVTF